MWGATFAPSPDDLFIGVSARKERRWRKSVKSDLGAHCFFAVALQGLYYVAGGVELHCDIAFVGELREFSVDVAVVDLAGAGFVAAGDVRDVDEGYFRDVLFELLDEVSESSLLVVEVVEDLDVWACYGFRHLKGFCYSVEIDGWVFEA